MTPIHRQPIILHVIWATWLIPYYGRKWAPAYFGQAVVQWGSAILIAALVPIAVFSWLTPTSRQGTQKASWFFLFKAITPLLFLVIFQGIMIDPLTRIVAQWKSETQDAARFVAEAKDMAIRADTPEKRGRVAALTYQLYGIRIDWRNREGNIGSYTPSESDTAKLERRQLMNDEVNRAQGNLKRILVETKWLLAMNAVSLAVPLGVFFWRTKRSCASPSLGV